MSGYLDQYGAGEDQRNRIIFSTIGGLILVLVLGSLSWYLLEHHHQESVIKSFLNSIRNGDYKSAYQTWGCTPQKPCSGYSFENFMDDWGPQKSAPDLSVLGLADSESCNDAVLLTVVVNRNRTDSLWMDHSSDSISFAPYSICPHKSPFSIMLHRTIGKLRKPLLK